MIVTGHAKNALIGLHPQDMREAPEGVTIASLAPEKVTGLLLCRCNGEWLSRDSWESLTREGDVIEWHELPQDRDSLRTVLSVVVVAAVNYYTGGLGSGFTAGLIRGVATAASLAAVSALIPQKTIRSSFAGNTGDTFATSLQGNQARIDQPIWKVCGFDEINPPFACQPYTEFLARPGAVDPELDRDQYFYAVYCVGIGNHDVVAKIGNTPIGRFDDVLVAQYLAPGVQPSTVQLNVVTAPEVQGEIMEPGRYVGGYVACGANRTVDSIGIDIVAPKGLGKSSSLTVTWQVEYREINDFGQILSNWAVLDTETRTAFTATPQRWSNTYALPSAARVEVRVVRTDVQDTDPAALHEIAWGGMRAFLAEPATMNPNAAHYEVVMRATGQLSGQTTADVRLQVKAHARTRDSGAWGAEEFTRNPALWLLDLASSDVWGLGLPDDRIDLASFDNLMSTCDARQDRFDFTFDTSVDAWSAMQSIARVCRARVFRRYGILSVVRDEKADLPVTAFMPRNSMNMRIRETMRREDSPDAVIVQYRDHRTRDWADIVCPLPGVEASDVSNPVYLQLPGVIGYTQALREGLFEAASSLYRTPTVYWTTEMEGMLPAYLSPVRWQSGLVVTSTSGDVEYVSGLTYGLSTEIDHTETQYIMLIRDDGTVTDAIEVSAGATAFEVILDSSPGFTPHTEGSTRERTKFIIGPMGSDSLVRVDSIGDGGLVDGAQMYDMTGFIDDDRVHDIDLAYLPETDEIQDPIGLPDDVDETGEVLLTPNLNARTITVQTISGVGTVTDPMYAEFTLDNTGILSYETDSGSVPMASGSYANEWLLYGAVDPSDAGAFEVQFTLVTEIDTDAAAVLSGDTLATWHSLSTSRTVRYEAATGNDVTALSYATIKVEIRDVATSIVVISRNITLRLEFADGGGGA